MEKSFIDGSDFLLCLIFLVFRVSLNCPFQNFLPSFGGDLDENEKLKTISMLLTGQNFSFGNPVEKFKTDLVSGKLSSDHVKMTKVLQKAKYRKYK